MRLISVISLCLFRIVNTIFKKWLFITMSKRTCFIFQPMFPLFSGILAGQRAQKQTLLPPLIGSDISSVVFFDDTSWRSSAAVLLVKLCLFSSLRRSKFITTCYSIFCPLTSSAEMSPLDFTATVKLSLECFLTWLQLLPLSFLSLLFFYVFQNHLD